MPLTYCCWRGGGPKASAWVYGNRGGCSDKITEVMIHYGNKKSPIQFPSLPTPTYGIWTETSWACPQQQQFVSVKELLLRVSAENRCNYTLLSDLGNTHEWSFCSESRITFILCNDIVFNHCALCKLNPACACKCFPHRGQLHIGVGGQHFCTSRHL